MIKQYENAYVVEPVSLLRPDHCCGNVGLLTVDCVCGTDVCLCLNISVYVFRPIGDACDLSELHHYGNRRGTTIFRVSIDDTPAVSLPC